MDHGPGESTEQAGSGVIRDRVTSSGQWSGTESPAGTDLPLRLSSVRFQHLARTHVTPELWAHG